MSAKKANQEPFADRAKRVMAEHDLTREELADMLGMLRTSMQRYLSGERTPRGRTVDILLDYIERDLKKRRTARKRWDRFEEKRGESNG